jgi:dihydroorotate dehydrogenase
VLKQIYRLTEGKIPLIGVGGIASAEDAYQKIRAGASAIQIYTALIYQGFGLVEKINRGLIAQMEREGISSLAALIGKDV